MGGIRRLHSSSSPSSAATEFDIDTRSHAYLRAALNECLNNIQSPGSGSFATFGNLSNPPNPNIYLKNGGGIGLPLSDRDAQAIIATSHVSTSGKGEKEVENAMQKIWELSPGDFELRNLAWEPFVQYIVAKVGSGLGMNLRGRGVTAELDKISLNDKGAMLKSHQNSEKASRVFATLDIVLPSKHEGGQVRMTNSGETKVFETSHFSEFDVSYIAWLSDVIYEGKPVLSGYQLILTYNLTHNMLDSTKLSATSNIALANLQYLLSLWKENMKTNPNFTSKLAYLLEHQYTDTELCFEALIGRDHQVAANLRKACEEHDFVFYLANLRMTLEGGCGEDDYEEFHEIVEETSREILLKRVVDLKGTEVFTDRDFDEANFIQELPFKNIQPDEEDYQGYCDEDTTTQIYNRTVAIIMPKSYKIEMIFNSPKLTYGNYSGYTTTKVESQPHMAVVGKMSEISKNLDDEMAREDLRQICQMVIRQSLSYKYQHSVDMSYIGRAPYPEEVIARIVEMCVDLDNQKMFLDAFGVWSGKMAPSTFQAVGVAIIRYSLDDLLPRVASQLSLTATLSERLDIIRELGSGLQKETDRRSGSDYLYKDWLISQINLALSSSTMAVASAMDGYSLAQLSQKFSSQDIFNKLLPVVKRNVKSTPMAAAFLIGLFEARDSGDIPEDVTRTIFHDIVSDIADSFSLVFLSAPLAESNKRMANSATSYTNSIRATRATPFQPIDHNTSRSIAALLCHCQLFQLHNELNEMIGKLVAEAGTVAELDQFDRVFLPLLKLLIPLLREKEIRIQGSPFQRLFQQLLGIYIKRFVRIQPPLPQHWAQVRILCSCQYCRSLNEFLVNPYEMVGRFPLKQESRDHLERAVRVTGHATETDQTSYPPTLVVTKTKPHHLAEYRAWVQRCDIARKHLQEMGSENLKELLAEMHGPIMGLSVSSHVLQTATQASALALSMDASNRTLPPITKRKLPSRDVIVLDDSD